MLPHQAHRSAARSRILGDTLGDAAKRALVARPRTVELTAREVAKRLRVSTATVYALCRRKELEHHRVSHAIRISEGALATYLATASTSAVPSGAGKKRSA